MDTAIMEIKNWANRGTLRQFQIESDARLEDTPYTSDLDDDTLTFYRVEKEGGVLGIGAHEVREPVLKLADEGEEIVIVPGTEDEAFVQTLAESLRQH